MQKRSFTEPSFEEEGEFPHPDTPGARPCADCEPGPFGEGDGEDGDEGQESRARLRAC